MEVPQPGIPVAIRDRCHRFERNCRGEGSPTSAEPPGTVPPEHALPFPGSPTLDGAGRWLRCSLCPGSAGLDHAQSLSAFLWLRLSQSGPLSICPPTPPAFPSPSIRSDPPPSLKTCPAFLCSLPLCPHKHPPEGTPASSGHLLPRRPSREHTPLTCPWLCHEQRKTFLDETTEYNGACACHQTASSPGHLNHLLRQL